MVNQLDVSGPVALGRTLEWGKPESTFDAFYSDVAVQLSRQSVYVQRHKLTGEPLLINR